MSLKWWLAPMLLVASIGVASAAAATGHEGIDAAALAQRGDPAHGVPPCSSCHGAAGQGNAAAGFPRLAGLPAAYADQQLKALADGHRDSAVMAPVAKTLSPGQRKALAVYFAGLSAPGATPPSTPVPALGAELAEHGRWADNLPACEQCHGPHGVGVGEAFPPLAGQSATYIANQLRAWKQHKRPAGPLGLMGAVADKLSEADIKAVAAYFAAQPVSGTEERP